jgi:hypothetical protein
LPKRAAKIADLAQIIATKLLNSIMLMAKMPNAPILLSFF